MSDPAVIHLRAESIIRLKEIVHQNNTLRLKEIIHRGIQHLRVPIHRRSEAQILHHLIAAAAVPEEAEAVPDKVEDRSI